MMNKVITSDAKTIRREWWLLIILASIQFTNLMDFVILMPLGPQLMRVFDISPQQFGSLVSVYTFSAGIVGVLGAMVIDRFDRKKALLTIYGGFACGNLFCALSPSYGFLLIGRVITGAFGGILSAVIFAIIGDVIPDMRRGKAIGTVMASFSLATVTGVPVGLFLATSYGWHIPFFMLVVTSVLILIVGYFVLPLMKEHIAHYSNTMLLKNFLELLANRSNVNSFIFMSAVVFTGFSVIPYISPYLVSNVGLPENELPLVYLLGGAATMFTSRYFGKLTDRFGKPRIFTWIAALSIIPLVVLTNLPTSPLWIILSVTTLFMVFVSGRMVPAMALVTASVEPKQRGSFMSINSSIQQFSSGLASFGAGTILGTTTSGRITHYGTVGIIAVATSLLCIYLAYRIRNVETASNISTSPNISMDTV